MMSRVLWVVFCLLTLMSGVWALGPDEVFIQNKGSAVTNSPVVVPISFQDGQMSQSQLVNLQLKSAGENLPTQAEATSYYKSGFVRTAVARVIVSLSANQEKVFTIGAYSGSPPSFVMDPRIDTLLKNGQLKVQITDIMGGTYETKVDVDNPLYSGHVTLVSDGPVAKIYQVVKRHDPVAGGMPEDLTHLFSSIFYVTVYTGKDYVLVDHFLVNSNNLKEDPAPAPTGGFPNGSGYQYVNPQYGAIFYTDAKMIVDTGTTSHAVYTLDSFLHAPSRVDTDNSTGTKTVYLIMPEDGQQILYDEYGDGPDIAQQSNFIGSGQGFVTRHVISFGGPLSKHPIEETLINSGQSLARWSLIDSYFFRDLPNPDKVNPLFNWETEAANTYADFLDEVSNANEAHRFGPIALSGFKDLRAGGYYDHYYQEPKAVVRYFLSCQQKCQKSLIDSMRFRVYGFAHASNHIVGYKADEHPNAMISGYGFPMIEKDGTSDSNPISCGVLYSATDFLGYCHNTKGTPISHRTDKFGQGLYTYSTDGPPRAIWHEWTISDPPHLSNGNEYYRYMLTGDFMSKYVGDSKLEVSVGGMYKYLETHSFDETQTRGRARALKNTAMAYSLSLDPFYKKMGGLIVDKIELGRNKSTPGTTGTNPFQLNDFLSVKYFNKEQTPQVSWAVHPFQHFLVGQGIAVAYRDMFLPSDPQAGLIKSMVKDGLYFAHEYVYRKPTKVRNGVDIVIGSTNFPLWEGRGFFGSYYVNINLTPTSNGVFPKINIYDGQPQRQAEEQPGLVSLLILAGDIRQGDPSFMPEYDLYFADYQEAFRGVWSQGTEINGATNPKTWGVSLIDLFDDPLFGMSYFLGIPTSSNRGFNNGYFSNSYSPSCPDADGDGQTTCAGDCADNNPNINSNKSENSCTDGVDNNCNLLIDCNDPVCGQYTLGSGGSWSIANSSCAGKPYCGNGVVDAGEQCEVSPSQEGKFTPINPTPPYTCIPAFTSQYLGCVYSATSTFYLTGINPNSITYNAPATLILSGGGFASTNKVDVGTLTNLTPTNITTNQMQVNLSAAQTTSLGVGNHVVKVKEGSTTTNSLTLGITQPVPTISSLTPTSAIAYGTTVSLTLTGTNFSPNARVIIDSGVNPTLLTITPTSASSTQLSFSPTITQINSLGVGSHLVWVDNQDGQISNPVSLSVFLPSLSSISPAAVNMGSGQLFTLSGNLMLSGATVQVGSLPPISTTLIDFTQHTFTLSNTNIQTLGAGTHSIQLTNPGGGVSNAISLTINAVGSPILDTIAPPDVEWNTTKIFTLNGSGFQNGATVTLVDQFNSSKTLSVSTTFNSSGSATFTLTAAQTQTLGPSLYHLFLTNPDGKKSNILSNMVIYVPYVSGITPNNLVIGSPATLQVSGLYFNSGATILIGGLTISPSSVAPASIQFQLTGAQSNTLGIGIHPITVKNPAGGLSNTNVSLAINPAPIPAPTNLSATASGNAITLQWTDNASNETGQTIERSTDNLNFAPILPALGPNVQTFTDSGLGVGTYFYRIQSFNTTQSSPYSNVTSATIGGVGESSPSADVMGVSSTVAASSLGVGDVQTVTVSLTKNQTDSLGYTDLKTLVAVTLCRTDDPDPLKSQVCVNSDYATAQNLLFLIESPDTLSFYLNQKSYNFNSSYPPSFGSNGSVAMNAYVTDAGPNSLTYSFIPSAIGLLPGSYKAIAIALPGNYQYDSLGDGEQPITETDTGNNFSHISFTVMENSPTVDSPPSTPSTSGGGGGGGGGGDGSSGDDGLPLEDAIPTFGGTDGLSCASTEEVCNGVDDDCDGSVDESCEIILGTDTGVFTNGALVFLLNLFSILIAVVQLLFGQ